MKCHSFSIHSIVTNSHCGSSIDWFISSVNPSCFLVREAASKTVPMIPTSCYSCHHIIPPLWICISPRDWFLTEPIKTDGMSCPRPDYKRPWCPSYWRILSDSSVSHALMKSVATLWYVVWEGPYGKELRMTSKQQLAGSCSPQSSSTQQFTNNWILQMTTLVIWEVSPSQLSPQITVALINALSAAWDRFWAEDPTKPHLHSWPKKLWNNKYVLVP